MDYISFIATYSRIEEIRPSDRVEGTIGRMLHRKQAMKCLVPRPIKFYKILRPVTTDARLWFQTDVRCICGRQFTFLSFTFLFSSFHLPFLIIVFSFP